MKFFEFVSCCGPAVRPSVRPDSPTSSSSFSQAPPPAEEKRSLVPSPGCRRWRKQGRIGASGSARALAEWKPSLFSISEDNVVMVERFEGEDRRDQDRTSGSERLVKRKSGSRSSRTKVVVNSFGDDFGRSSFPTVIPAFSPTPLMF